MSAEREPSDNLGPNTYTAPTNSWEQAALRQATVVLTLPRADVRAFVRPPLPQVGAVKAKQVRHHVIGLEDAIEIYTQDHYADRRSWFSGTPAGYSGSPIYGSAASPY